jgi:hypothetical protein
VERGQRQLFDQADRTRELLRSLPRETGDHVAADEDVRDLRHEPRHRLPEGGGRVTAVHPGEHPVIATLEREVYMRTDGT